jgi:Zn-dependent protease
VRTPTCILSVDVITAVRSERCVTIAALQDTSLPELPPDRIAQFVIWYVVLLFSLSVHESAHAWMALRMGDRTAADDGRITLNPLVHIDPIGTVVMPILQLFSMGLPLLAWAKPTPVQPRNFRPGMFRRGHILVWGAGPTSNFLLAVLFTAALFVAVRVGLEPHEGNLPYNVLRAGVLMNVVLGVFNLVPLPPFDGSWVLSWALPRRLGEQYDRVMEPYGQYILLIAFVTGALGFVTRPLTTLIVNLLTSVIHS